MSALLSAHNVCKSFRLRSGLWKKKVEHKALLNISLSIYPGETVGLVGESGCGKSTLARLLTRITPADSGTIAFEGTPIKQLHSIGLKTFRRNVQMIFQDPAESLNPRHTIEVLLREPFIIHDLGTSKEREACIDELLETVGLPLSSRKKYAFEFSGGQRQRIGIARAIALQPRLIICDEPTSALDVSVQAQILNLLTKLQQKNQMAYLFISHDLAVVRHLCSRVAVMKCGCIVEEGPTETLLQAPQHPYTQELVRTARSLE